MMSKRFWRRDIMIVSCVMLITFHYAMASDAANIGKSDAGIGVASWYGGKYRGRFTASGERFDPSDMTAAHPSLPMGTLVEVSRSDQGRSVVVRINDRGPGGGRILDFSEAAAKRLGMVREGTATVSLRVIGFVD